jgi:hypothetical protein
VGEKIEPSYSSNHQGPTVGSGVYNNRLDDLEERL